MKYLKFWLSQKVDNCLSLDLETYLSLKKFKVLILYEDLIF